MGNRVVKTWGRSGVKGGGKWERSVMLSTIKNVFLKKSSSKELCINFPPSLSMKKGLTEWLLCARLLGTRDTTGSRTKIPVFSGLSLWDKPSVLNPTQVLPLTKTPFANQNLQHPSEKKKKSSQNLILYRILVRNSHGIFLSPNTKPCRQPYDQLLPLQI